MARVTTPGGTVALLVPGAHEHQQAFARFADLAVRHAGDEARSLLSTYVVCGDLNRLASLVESTGLQVTTARTKVRTYRAPSVDEFATTEVECTPLVQRISPDVYARIRTGAHHVLAPYTTDDRRVEAPFESNLVVAPSSTRRMQGLSLRRGASSAGTRWLRASTLTALGRSNDPK
jgi:hypothetical protein